jgi:hypothetical protein
MTSTAAIQVIFIAPVAVRQADFCNLLSSGLLTFF